MHLTQRKRWPPCWYDAHPIEIKRNFLLWKHIRIYILPNEFVEAESFFGEDLLSVMKMKIVFMMLQSWKYRFKILVGYEQNLAYFMTHWLCILKTLLCAFHMFSIQIDVQLQWMISFIFRYYLHSTKENVRLSHWKAFSVSNFNKFWMSYMHVQVLHGSPCLILDEHD